MMNQRPQGNITIIISLVIALALTILPLPDLISNWRPEWVALVLMYWVIALPTRIGVSSAWIMGLLLDVSKGALLGQHAFALSLLAFAMLHLYNRMRLYPMWQQSVVIGVILAIYQAILLWVYNMTGPISATWIYWAPSLSGLLLWPWIYVVLRDVRRHYRVQ